MEEMNSSIELEEFTSETLVLTENEKKLGPRRLKFVQSFIRNAGDKVKTSEDLSVTIDTISEYLRNGLVQKAITERLQVRDEVKRIDKDWVIMKMVRVADVCSREVPEYNKKGDIVGTKMIDAGTAHRVLKDIGSEIGMFKDKLEIGGGDKPVTVERKEIIVDVQNIAERLASKMITLKKPEEEEKK